MEKLAFSILHYSPTKTPHLSCILSLPFSAVSPTAPLSTATMSPPKLLEITVISAHDLPPLSKMLRTFAVVYISPDHKLKTKIDRHGHTNPTWNHKALYHVEDRFLRHEHSVVTIEIYNVAWLRDLPIGTARLFINNVSPPLHTNQALRRVSLQVCRPSGHLQGTLNLSLQVLDPEEKLNLFSIRNVVQMEKEEGFQDQRKNPGPGISFNTSKNVSICNTPEYTNRPGLEQETTKTVDGSEKGVYMKEWNEYGSSIFDNWTEHGDDKSEAPGMKPGNGEWIADDLISSTPNKKRSGKKKGLFSCIGNMYGFRFSIICGSNKKKKKKKSNRNVNKQNVQLMTYHNEDLRRFYV